VITLRVALASLVLLVNTVTPVSAIADGCDTASWHTARGQAAGRRPVVLVHGWTGDPMILTANTLETRLRNRISTFPFDYNRRSLFWASDEQIAGCLGRFVDAVAEEHRKVGGDGKVVAVAHSMGGLALRYALRDKTTTVPNIITLGTPNLGSPWGATELANLLHDARQQGKDQPPRTQKAALCLGTHNKGSALPPGCESELPPWLPADTKLTQVAGDITVDRTLFGIRLYSLPLFSDGVVPVPSAHGYFSSGPGGESPAVGARLTNVTEACRIDHGLLLRMRANHPLVTLVGLAAVLALDYVTLQDLQSNTLSPATGFYLALAAFFASCSHMKQAEDAPTLDRVASALSDAVDNLAQPIPVNPNDYRMPDSPWEYYVFKSPSKNFTCGIMLLQPSAGCHGKTSPVPPRPERCSPNINWGSGLFVDANGKTDFICTGGLQYGSFSGSDEPVLPYGRSLTAGGFTCVSKQAGIMCSHQPSGHGFRIAAESNEQF
jgi:pimeloyl-ACP methyl ester carboxylesterase